MKKELMVFFNAVMFLTRIRVPAFVQHQPEYLQQTPRYYPVTGMIVGALATLSFLVVNRYISPDLAIVAYMVTSILTTGAFHEDGFADVCDAFGGGWIKAVGDDGLHRIEMQGGALAQALVAPAPARFPVKAVHQQRKAAVATGIAHIGNAHDGILHMGGNDFEVFGIKRKKLEIGHG